MANHAKSAVQRLAELAELREKGLISDAEFDRLKAASIVKGEIIGAIPSAASGDPDASGCSGFTLITVGVALILPAFAALSFLEQKMPELANATTLGLFALAVGAVLAFFLTVFIYLLPSYFAFKRKHPNRVLILVLNLLFGVTLLGWVLLLIWALRAAHISPTGNGGESGLNVFANDGHSRGSQSAPGNEPTSATDELEILTTLRSKGALTDDEYSQLRTNLLSKL